MTTIEFRRWAKKRAMVACRKMHAQITEKQCRVNQRKARAYASNQCVRHSMGDNDGECYHSYIACAFCKKANPPIKRHGSTCHVDLLADMPHPEVSQ